MKVEQLHIGSTEEFIKYAKKHKLELDDSFLYDDDLRNFVPNEENPTYIIRNKQGEVVAAASLIIDDYARRGRKARFRIFHSEVNHQQYYDVLMKAILKHTKGLEKIYIFVPVVNEELDHAIKQLAFTLDRYAFLLLREDLEVPAYNLPDDYEMKVFRLGHDEDAWCKVRNASFATLKGSETPQTPEMVRKMMTAEDQIEEGAMILFHEDKPVGVIKSSDDEYEGQPIMDIGPIAITPEYQGKGLGRMMLRAALNLAKEKGYKRTILSVNAENEWAKTLYIQEGFKQVEAVTCYHYYM
ncbi:GNAT family N-acetyltransferase [Virgibacillus flavescens]|uniref:GNAT family N-acetyltransferase n=1 Tax=Virgibacillus flavescens TaxID=1611422 RepID=UPI003D336CD3